MKRFDCSFQAIKDGHELIALAWQDFYANHRALTEALSQDAVLKRFDTDRLGKRSAKA